MSQCEEELCGGEEGYRIPDHSVLLWDVMVDGAEPDVSDTPTKKCEERPRKKLVVPEDYMSGQEDFIVSIVARLKRLSDDQGELDALYSDLLEGLKSGLKEVICEGKKQGQGLVFQGAKGPKKGDAWEGEGGTRVGVSQKVLEGFEEDECWESEEIGS